MEGPFNLVASVGIFLLMEDIFRVVIGGLGVVDRDFSGLEGGTGVGSLVTVWDLVTARLLPRLGVLRVICVFGVLGKSPGNVLLLDPLLNYSLIRIGGLIAMCVRPTT